jgi:hypothetical protein
MNPNQPHTDLPPRWVIFVLMENGRGSGRTISTRLFCRVLCCLGIGGPPSGTPFVLGAFLQEYNLYPAQNQIDVFLIVQAHEGVVQIRPPFTDSGHDVRRVDELFRRVGPECRGIYFLPVC